MRPWPFDPLVPLSYDLILADPAVEFALWSDAGEEKAPQGQYQCHTFDDLARWPVSHLARGDAWMVCWAWSPNLPQCIELMRAWGFRYVTAGTWAKQSSTGRAWHFGPGYVLRSAAEFFLVGKIGAPPRGSMSVRNLIVAPFRGHSRKPDEIYALCEALCPGGRYCELFARQRCGRPGWDAWGNEVDKFEATKAEEPTHG